MKRLLLCSVPTAVLAVAILVVVAHGEDPTKKPLVPPDSDFKGKVLMIFSRIPQQGAVLQNVQLKPLGMRFFLVGKIGGGDAKSPTMWLAVDDITMISVFSNLDDAKNAYAEARKALEDR